MSDDRFKKLIAVLIAVTTVFAGLLAQLEAEAGARARGLVVHRDSGLYRGKVIAPRLLCVGLG